MKTKTLIFVTGIILCALFVCTASASGKELPTKGDLNDFIDSIPKEKGFANAAFEKSVNDNPSWPCDIWPKDIVSFYYDNPDSKLGYTSVYYDDDGNIITPECDGPCVPVKKHTGDEKQESIKEEEKEEDKEETEHVGVTAPESARTVIKNGIKTEGKNTFEDLGKALDDYDGKLSCKSLKCANSLKEYLQEKGFKANVEIRVNIETEDEGDVYITL